MPFTKAIFPARYVQGENALSEAKEEIDSIGVKPLFIAGKRGWAAFGSTYAQFTNGQLEGIGELSYVQFGGECSVNSINSLVKTANDFDCIDVIVGVGGGKSLDTAKAVADEMKLPVVIIPTIASTDAPCSALSVIYSDEGVYEDVRFFKRNPDLVIVDTTIIAKAPVRTLVSGMGDALATWFEADSCLKSGALNCAGGTTSRASHAIARVCYQTLLKSGPEALLAAQKQEYSEALDAIVEANTLLSGLGFESGGLATAHGLHNAMTIVPATHQHLHGEKVAFATLTSVFLTKKPDEEIKTVFEFCKAVGLPTTLQMLHMTTDDVAPVSEECVLEGNLVHNEPFKVNAKMVADAMLAANAYGLAME